ncbi:protein of unknown function [Nitrosotalea devaniterrae]|uniref:Uncharacterized protein n=1 Tax=Nitrosotalea devaniterrae TaxID=1078905 RepID=A0A128A4F9_9ARCH|nr:protein of unknown function [Candidatus Nitrosotalea devanaterra]
MTEITEKESDLIIECQVRRFTTEEALAYLAKNGITMSDRTYRRHKNEIEDKFEERISEAADIGRVQQLVLGIDTLKQVEKEKWNLFSSTQNDVLKERILESIIKTQERFTDYYTKVALRAMAVKSKIAERKKAREASIVESSKQGSLTN